MHCPVARLQTVLVAEPKPSANLGSAKGSARFCQGPPQAGSGRTSKAYLGEPQKSLFRPKMAAGGHPDTVDVGVLVPLCSSRHGHAPCRCRTRMCYHDGAPHAHVSSLRTSTTALHTHVLFADARHGYSCIPGLSPSSLHHLVG